ncbi:hypothetical protein C4D60_Mb02t14980 [Musa balbisiana]|uniref:Mon2/Sec7/BIG1-like dimerisation and cyclophilin-binding domain-containing protein n=1 Tax=Musa balbisiana TaxID=52838 RepID=A0A4S8IAS7_MUSBA|nr:hypothetical protein C4D60_Mb02t14980 [Musa balbisiana]
MAGAAAAGFIIRSLEAMLKECAGKKYPALQSSVQTCLDNMKETKQELTSDEHNNAATLAGNERSDGDLSAKEGEAPASDAEKDVVTVRKSQETSEPIIAALANAGHTLDAAQAELVLKPLRLAFETKNIKLLEPALDCLHLHHWCRCCFAVAYDTAALSSQTLALFSHKMALPRCRHCRFCFDDAIASPLLFSFSSFFSFFFLHFFLFFPLTSSSVPPPPLPLVPLFLTRQTTSMHRCFSQQYHQQGSEDGTKLIHCPNAGIVFVRQDNEMVFVIQIKVCDFELYHLVLDIAPYQTIWGCFA